MPFLPTGASSWWPGGRAPSTRSISACAGKPRPRSSMTRIRELLSYRLHEVANLLSRGAELRYRREFGVSLWEWRSIALLGGTREPVSLSLLAHAAGIHKSQMSRVVSGLSKRGLVRREPDPDDARGLRLTLSKTGQRLYDGLIRAASD